MWMLWITRCQRYVNVMNYKMPSSIATGKKIASIEAIDIWDYKNYIVTKYIRQGWHGSLTNACPTVQRLMK